MFIYLRIKDYNQCFIIAHIEPNLPLQQNLQVSVLSLCTLSCRGVVMSMYKVCRVLAIAVVSWSGSICHRVCNISLLAETVHLKQL